MIRGIEADAGSTNNTPYLALTGELWGVFCEYLWEMWPRYNGTALYYHNWVLLFSKALFYLKKLSYDEST